MTLKEICEKASCTQDDIVKAIIAESKENQKIIAEGQREARERFRKIELDFKTLEAENKKLTLLIENQRLSDQWREITNRISASKEGDPHKPKLEIVKE